MLAWRKDLSTLCKGRPRPSSNEPISVFFDEYEQSKKSLDLNTTRRKVILIKTFIAVQEKEQLL